MLTLGTPQPVRITTPTIKAASVADAKRQCQIAPSVGQHDDELSELVDYVVDDVFARTRFAVVEANYRFDLGGFPDALEGIDLPLRDVSAIVSVDYRDTDDAVQTMAGGDYLLETDRVWPHIVLADEDAGWPDTDVNPRTIVVVTVTAGAATQAAVNRRIRMAILAQVHWLWIHRGTGEMKGIESPIYKSIIEGLTANYP